MEKVIMSRSRYERLVELRTELEELLERLDVMLDDELQRDIEEGAEQIRKGDYVTLDELEKLTSQEKHGN